MFVTLSDGGIRNGYTIKILNKSREPGRYELTLAGLDDATLAVLGQEGQASEKIVLTAKPDAVTTYRIYVTVPAAALESDSATLSLVLEDPASGAGGTYDTVFRGPKR